MNKISCGDCAHQTQALEPFISLFVPIKYIKREPFYDEIFISFLFEQLLRLCTSFVRLLCCCCYATMNNWKIHNKLMSCDFSFLSSAFSVFSFVSGGRRGREREQQIKMNMRKTRSTIVDESSSNSTKWKMIIFHLLFRVPDTILVIASYYLLIFGGVWQSVVAVWR